MKLSDHPDEPYWYPIGSDSKFSKAAFDMIEDLGYPPDTNGWIETPTIPGWYSNETLGCIVWSLTVKGHSVIFHGAK